MAAGIRANNMAGISMEATGQLANAGSQIVRSIGGLGRSGAFAGMRTIQQVGAAVKTGALSEEDIYNATGLTGEQGQMAMAQNQLQSSAGFLRSGRGRYLLASLAGRNGQLNENALDEFMGGGFGVGRTRQLAGQNLGQVGRANFLRNEGRLRGEVLNRVGGNVNTLALMGWAGERGVDISAMGDREMLFAQRMLGMGRDEMDVSVKQANAMGDMNTFMKRQGMDDTYLREQATVRKNVGLEGLKNTFNQFREHAQSNVQSYGAKAYQDMSNWVERQLNKLMGTYSVELDKKLDDAYSNYMASGGQDRGAAATIARSRQIMSMGFGGGATPAGFGGGLSLDQYQKVAQGGTWGGASSKLGQMLGGQTLEDKTGYHFTFDPNSNLSKQSQLESYSRWSQAFARGAGTPPSKQDVGAIVSLGSALSSAGAASAIGNKQGPDRARAALGYAAAQGDPQAQQLLSMMDSGRPGDAEKAASVVNAALIHSGSRGIGGQTPFDFLSQGGGPQTGQDVKAWLAEPFMAKRLEGTAPGWAEKAAAGASPMFQLGRAVYNMFKGGSAKDKEENIQNQLGEKLFSREGKEQFFGALTGGEKGTEFDRARQEWRGELDKYGTEKGEKTADAAFAKLKMAAGIIGVEGMKQLQEQEAKGLPPMLSDTRRERLRDEFHMRNIDDVDALAINALHTTQRMALQERKATVDSARKQAAIAESELREGTASGLYASTGELTEGTQAAYEKMGLGWVGKMRQLHGKRLAAVAAGVDLDIGGADAYGQSVSAAVEAERHGPLEGKSSQELFKMASDVRNAPKGASETDEEYRDRLRMASQVGMEGKARRAAGATVQKGGEGWAASKWLGLNVDRGVQRRLIGAQGDINKQMAILTSEEGGMVMSEDKAERKAQEKQIEHALRVAGGKKNLGYSDKDLAAMTEDERKEIAGYNTQGKEERAARGRDEMRTVGRDQAARKEADRQKNDPQLQSLKSIEESIKRLVQVQTLANSDSNAKPVHVDNQTLSVKFLS